LVAASLVCAIATLVVPPQLISLLGALPLIIGAKKLYDAYRDADSSEPSPIKASTVTAIAAITIANGGDNIGIYVPLFAARGMDEVLGIIVVFALMTALWCAGARWLVHHPRLGAPIRYWGDRTLPFVLIALGVYILWDGMDDGATQ
jgi:cadmium resistance protein CadD (predicted permease)